MKLIIKFVESLCTRKTHLHDKIGPHDGIGLVRGWFQVQPFNPFETRDKFFVECGSKVVAIREGETQFQNVNVPRKNKLRISYITHGNV